MMRLLSCPSGWILLLSTVVLSAGGLIVDVTGVGPDAMALASALILFCAAGLPLLLVFAFTRQQFAYHMRLGRFSLKALPFVLIATIYAALLSSVLNALTCFVLSIEPAIPTGPIAGMTVFEMAALLFLPALLEELLLRGAVLRDLERCGGAGLLLCGLSFAMLHGDLSNFTGPLVAGMIYAWLCLVLDSVWPAVIAHLGNNLLVAAAPRIIRPDISVHPVALSVAVALVLLALLYVLLNLYESSDGMWYISEHDFMPGQRMENTLLTVFSLPFMLFCALFTYRICGMTWIRDIILSL